MLTFELNCPKCNTPIPINQETTRVNCPGCGVNIVFDDDDSVLDSVTADHNIDLYQTSQQQKVDTAGNLSETITVSFSKSEIYDDAPETNNTPEPPVTTSTSTKNILKPELTKAKRLGSLKIAKPVKDSIFGSTGTGASGIFKRSAIINAKPAESSSPSSAEAASAQSGTSAQATAVDSIGGTTLEEIQKKAIEEAKKQLQNEIEQQQEDIRKQAYEQARHDLMMQAKKETENKNIEDTKQTSRAPEKNTTKDRSTVAKITEETDTNKVKGAIKTTTGLDPDTDKKENNASKVKNKQKSVKKKTISFKKSNLDKNVEKTSENKAQDTIKTTTDLDPDIDKKEVNAAKAENKQKSVKKKTVSFKKSDLNKNKPVVTGNKEEYELDENGNKKLDKEGNPIVKKKPMKANRGGLSPEQKKELDQQIKIQTDKAKKNLKYLNLVLITGFIIFIIWWKTKNG